MSDAALEKPLRRQRVEPSFAGSFWGLFVRDLMVLRRNLGEFLSRTITQPLLFVFVFAYLFPKIGQGFSGGLPGTTFATVIVPGLVAVAALFSGITAVGLPLSMELGVNQEIEDRILAPLPVWTVALEKIAFGSFQALLSALVVFPLVFLVPATPVSVHVSNWALLIVVMALACLGSGCLGLVVGTLVRPDRIAFVFTLLVLPLTFLGCVYYPWARLAPVPWLQVIVLANPLVYVSEGLRAALTPALPHMPEWAFLLAMVMAVVLLASLGVRLFRRRVIG